MQAIQDKDGNLLSDALVIQNRWVEHFKLLNKKVVVDDDLIDLIDQLEIDNNLKKEPTMEELDNAIRELKRGKAVAEDRVSIEEWKLLKDAEPSLMLDLFRKVWRERKIPQEWKDWIIIIPYRHF